ncbi:tRNA dihydrouridine synthase DusB [Oricola thermophila]|uniref:tRNA-dihydrouridine synthase n=1 Tax=Oricola thermophila TaxID=2742145 RepID=A0A6N1VB31_9HYPH|nr:tRNA dihydrouridine synthase DusB [Oricola thermophila]QKV18176.1 tRNA dihydrouridine synthase DusB [Oricola thermophila]
MSKLGKPLDVGSVTLVNRVFLAPMSGVSDLPFRKRAQSHGAGLVVTEMIASEEFCKARTESRQRARGEGLSVRMLQLAGREARWMGEAARIAEGEGADIIDINMGCPAKKVTGGYAGSALMRDLDHAMSLITATVSAVKVPVTLKMRLGWDVSSINAPELAKRAEDSGVKMITVHGRTRCQFYTGRADWERIAAVREAVSVPLVVNGDITSLVDAQRACAASGADAVMVGRACYGQPWLAGRIAQAAGFAGSDTPPPANDDMADYVVAHYEDMLVHYGTEVGIRHARKHLGWYLDRHADPAVANGQLRKAIMTNSRPEEVIRLIGSAFSEAGPKARAA